MAGEDFVHVRLSPAGEKMAGKGGVVRITKGRCSFEFKVGVSQRVTSAYEWNTLLKSVRFQGEPVFEETTAPTSDEPAGAGFDSKKENE
jgi:hypothetical protein